MDRLLEVFEAPFVDDDGQTHTVQLYGRSRPGDTWEAWLVFVRGSDGARFATATETTQPSAEAVLYWATGLTSAYFEGAFRRAVTPRPSPRIVNVPPPLRDVRADRETYAQRLGDLEQQILNLFRNAAVTRMPTDSVLNGLPHAHADTVRAIEDLEKRRQLLERSTEGGSDWVVLTMAGLRAIGRGADLSQPIDTRAGDR
jgi:hypothetical protein